MLSTLTTIPTPTPTLWRRPSPSLQGGDSRGRRRRLPLWLAVLGLACAHGVSLAQDEPPPTVQRPAARHAEPAASDPEASVTIPAVEIVTFDLLLSAFNRRFSGSKDYDVTAASIRRNVSGGWVTDNDPFKINQFAHPYQGSLYHGAGRSAGLSYWQASALTFAGSAWWELTGEITPPSRNDQIASGIAGSFLGEPLFRMAHLMLDGPSQVPYRWRQWAAAAVSPALGVNRLLYGSRFDAAFDDHDPVYYGRLHVGAAHATQAEFDKPVDYKRNALQLDFALDYGLPGQAGYTYRRPFDYFAIQALLSSANGVENLSTRGLLFGTDYAVGDNYRGIWGLYANYDYLAPQIFHVSTTSLSLGSTGQWWVIPSVALQGTALAGLGYSAASTTHGTAIDTEYHYGMAPRLALAFRAIAGDRVSADVSAKLVSLGRFSNRAAGTDDITRVDSALTWRFNGPHAIGVNYVWSHRDARYPTAGGNQQTLASVGLYYTVLGRDGLGAVDWRTPSQAPAPRDDVVQR